MEIKKFCEKCGFECEDIKEKFGLTFCNVCFTFAPNDPEKLDLYVSEKIDSESINPFRKYVLPKGYNQKTGMIKKASVGKSMSRAPFGYKLINKKLVPAEYYHEVEEIFDEFLVSNLSLNKLSKKHNLSVNGLKKVLTNFTYVGKIKFNGEIYEGNHTPIVSSTLFNHVQNKLENLKIKKIN